MKKTDAANHPDAVPDSAASQSDTQQKAVTLIEDPFAPMQSTQAEQLRVKAETTLQKYSKSVPRISGSPSPETAQWLFHELHVHQIELEMQNEDLKQTQIALETSRARYFALYDQAPVGYLTLDELGVIQQANLTACRLLGVSRSALIERSITDFIRAADQDLYYLHRKQLMTSDLPGVTELHLCKADGVEFWARLETNQTKALEGREVFRVVISDITLNKQSEQLLLAAKLQAETNERLKSEFIANMNHEIRTPMNAIVGISELIMCQDVSPKVHQYLEYMSSATHNLLDIVNNILDLSKIESGCMAIETVPFELAEMLNNLRGLFALQALQKQLAFTLEVGADIPKSLVGDGRIIQRILSNLLGNAIKFTQQGEIRLRVEMLEAKTDLVVLEFSVEDSGIGISAPDAGKLFQPFSQVDGTISRRFGGTGLGLAISQRLLQLMNSQCCVSSIPEKGSRFSFKLTLGV
ncbi:MAG: ATP-binding protein [Methylomonas sp.]|jgi:PAS domain S-box-containing protein|uniref:PAS domain-containing hybrid sensor histidine kinase/response regulator n=1 Tax=Methylomonas sp. TaxID=418 RepID=UPI0025D19A3B|nr:PAS domain-containing hybrid sensor histidine kinase/response regulator [Methylomonas sp.]MCK9606158.1 ATP-binding protein [Methylomonas sp.]